MQTKEVCLRASCYCPRVSGLFLVAAIFMAGAALPSSASQAIANNTPNYVATAPNLGPADPSTVIDVSIWLKPHSKAAMDQLAHDLYDRTSPSYRQWLKSSGIAARFAPSAEQVKSVEEFFQSHDLKILTVGPNNFYVRARGTIADVEAAFQVTLNKYKVRGETIRANDRDPYIDDDAAAAVAMSVTGLDSGHYSHPFVQRPAAVKDKTLPAAEVTPSASNFFSADCFTGTTTEKFSTNGAFPKATYSGNAYFTDNENPGCAYTPPDISTAYNLSGLYAEGFNGTGQTIVIIDWCGSLTIRSDANVFSARFGLPALNSSNFQIIYTPTPSTCAAPDPEINLDVEWAHAIAPGANIVLVVPPSSSFQDIDQAVFYAVNYDPGNANTLSGSYGAPESLVAPSILETENLISEIAAISGISTNYSSGDDGDFTEFGIPPTVSTPADLPYATGVGGITLALNSNKSISWQAGWGNDVTYLDDEGYIFDPPFATGFYAGSGGGASGFFGKPSYQSSLKGSWRLVPDVSWLADPFTGAVIYLTEDTGAWYAVGGTSVSTPMFSALWAIANEEAGAPLGQAAPYLYTMPSSTIFDIVPVGSKTNVRASIKQSATQTDTYNPDEVMGLPSGTVFYSGLWNYPFESDVVLAVSFGTDTSLATKAGWDDVTGVGVPNAEAFANYFAPPASSSVKTK